MRILEDGTVIQSSLSAEGGVNSRDVFWNDVSLKKGVIIEIYYPEDKQNLSKEFVEYDVLASDERSDGSMSFITYLRCQAIDFFGSPNNFCIYTLMPPDKKNKGIYEKGAQVLLLAVGGNATAGKAYIIGGFPYPRPKEERPKKEDGQFYRFRFNGIDIHIDKDGQYFLTFNTPISVDGKKKDEKAAGTKLSILKDGKLILTDNEGQTFELNRSAKTSTWTNGAETITLNKQNKSITVQAGQYTENIKDAKTTTIESKDYQVETKSGSIKIKSGKDFNIDAQSNCTIKAGSNWSVESGANVTIKGNMVEIKAGSLAKISAQTVQLASGSVPAAGVGISKCLGMGPTGPIMSDIITGSATTLIGS